MVVDNFPRVSLRGTHGYSPSPRWGLMRRVGGRAVRGCFVVVGAGGGGVIGKIKGSRPRLIPV